MDFGILKCARQDAVDFFDVSRAFGFGRTDRTVRQFYKVLTVGRM